MICINHPLIFQIPNRCNIYIYTYSACKYFPRRSWNQIFLGLSGDTPMQNSNIWSVFCHITSPRSAGSSGPKNRPLFSRTLKGPSYNLREDVWRIYICWFLGAFVQSESRKNALFDPTNLVNSFRIPQKGRGSRGPNSELFWLPDLSSIRGSSEHRFLNLLI